MMFNSLLTHTLSNFAVLVFKVIAYLYTGSATMLSEAIHSLADMLNQVKGQPLHTTPNDACISVALFPGLSRLASL